MVTLSLIVPNKDPKVRQDVVNTVKELSIDGRVDAFPNIRGDLLVIGTIFGEKSGQELRSKIQELNNGVEPSQIIFSADHSTNLVIG